MRTRSIMLLALALGCGLVASIGISQYMDVRNKGLDEGEKQPVFVAMADIRANEELTAQNVKLEEWPKKIIPQGALTRLEEVEGKRTRLKLYAGEPILASKLLGPEDMIGAAREIPPGYRVAYVRVDPLSGSSNLILPGDRVDVLVYRNPGAADAHATAAKIVLQDIKVFAVDTQTESEFTATKDEHTQPLTAKTISLLVTPQQAVVLHAAQEISGTLRLVLRNPEDDAMVVDRGATLSDIFGSEEEGKGDRIAEKATTPQKETSEMTSWLDEQSQTANASPLPPHNAPAMPAVPPTPGPRKMMLVMMGSELVQVEIPGNGQLPLINSERGPASLGGNGPAPSQFNPVPPAEFPPAPPTNAEEPNPPSEASS
jgi:pilus assembly protein CpaB